MRLRAVLADACQGFCSNSIRLLDLHASARRRIPGICSNSMRLLDLNASARRRILGLYSNSMRLLDQFDLWDVALQLSLTGVTEGGYFTSGIKMSHINSHKPASVEGAECVLQHV